MARSEAPYLRIGPRRFSTEDPLIHLQVQHVHQVALGGPTSFTFNILKGLSRQL